jgi:hypothetical protein
MRPHTLSPLQGEMSVRPIHIWRWWRWGFLLPHRLLVGWAYSVDGVATDHLGFPMPSLRDRYGSNAPVSPLADRLDRPGNLLSVGDLMRTSQATLNTDAEWRSPAGHRLRIARVRRWALGWFGPIPVPRRRTVAFRYFVDGVETDMFGWPLR